MTSSDKYKKQETKYKKRFSRASCEVAALRAALEQPGLGALLSVRGPNVRSRSEIRKFASEGTKQGGNNHQTTILDLVRPAAHGAPRAGFPPPLTLPCCGTYLQGGNGVDVQCDSTGVYPAHRRNQRPQVPCGKWQGYTPPGLPSCRTRAKLFSSSEARGKTI